MGQKEQSSTDLYDEVIDAAATGAKKLYRVLSETANTFDEIIAKRKAAKESAAEPYRVTHAELVAAAQELADLLRRDPAGYDVKFHYDVFVTVSDPEALDPETDRLQFAAIAVPEWERIGFEQYGKAGLYLLPHGVQSVVAEWYDAS